MTAIAEQLTPAAATNRALFASNPSGAAGAPVVILHGLADENGSQLGGSAKALSTADAGLGTDGTSPPSLPGGATGVRGWLRYIGSLLAGTLQVAFGSLPAGSNTIGAVLQSGSTGTDFSASGAAVPTGAALTATPLLLTIPATPSRAFVEVQNQSTGQLQLVRDDGAGNNITSMLLAPGSTSTAGVQGGGWSSATFKGRVRVYGASGSQVAAYQD